MKKNVLLIIAMIGICVVSCKEDDGTNNSINNKPSITDIKIGSTHEEVINALPEDNVTEDGANLYCHNVGNYSVVAYDFSNDTLNAITLTVADSILSKVDIEKIFLKDYNYIGVVSSSDAYVNENNTQIAVIYSSSKDDVKYNSLSWSLYK